MLTESDLQDRLQINASNFVLFGDPAYYHAANIVSGYPGAQISTEQQLFNTAMSSTKLAVDWNFGIVLNLFNGLRITKSFKLYSSPVALYYRVAVIFTNLHNCSFPNQISQFYNCRPTSVEEYLHSCGQE